MYIARWLALFRRVLALVAGCAAGVVCASAGDTRSAAAADKPIVLPKFVTLAESLEFQGWQRYASPHFVIYSDGPRSEIELAMRQLETFRAFLGELFSRQVVNSQSVILIPTSSKDWKRVESHFTGAMANGGLVRVDLVPYRKLDIGDSDGCALLYFVCAFGLPETLDLPGAIWFRMVASLHLMQTRFERGGAILRTRGSTGGSRWRSSSGEFRKFTIGTSASDPAYWLDRVLTTKDPVHLSKLQEWILWTHARGPVSRESVQRVFACDASVFEASKSRKETVAPVAVKSPWSDMAIEVREAKVLEMRELFLLVAAIRRSHGEGDEALTNYVVKGLKTESLRSLLASALLAHGRTADAIEQLRLVHASGNSSAQLCAQTARLLFDQRTKDLSVDFRFHGDTAEIEALCVRAIELEPLLSAPRLILAMIEAFRENLRADAVARIRALMPGRATAADDGILAACAVAAWRRGDIEEARSTANELIAGERVGPRNRKISEEVLARMTPRAPLPNGTEQENKLW